MCGKHTPARHNTTYSKKAYHTMNTQSTVQHLLDADWHVAIQEQLELFPNNIAFAVEPEAMGQYDAEHGLPCDPVSRGYTKLGDIETYIITYKDTTTLWANMVDKINAEHAFNEAEQDLVDDVLFNMRGAW